MIGLFDTGHGGLTVYRTLARRFPARQFIYLGDHAHAPYGTRSAEEVIAFTRMHVEKLFTLGCPLVLLACNTATAVAAKYLQQEWLPSLRQKHLRVLGIIAPTVERATGTPWAVTTPDGPQGARKELMAVFGTTRTIHSGVYVTEIHKRCPGMEVVQQACPNLAGMIEEGESEDALEAEVVRAVGECLAQTGGRAPRRAILGCTHFPIVEHLFRRTLPPDCEILCQGQAVAEALEDYLARHPEFAPPPGSPQNRFLTTGDAARVIAQAERFLGARFPFEALDKNAGQ